MGVIESGRGGAVDLGIVKMTYYDSYVLPGSNYVATLTAGSGEDQLSYVGTASTTTSGDVAASLWLFNDGTVPIPSMVPTFALPRVGMPIAEYTAPGTAVLSVRVTIEVITSIFDPTTILTIADLDAITTSKEQIFSQQGISRAAFGTNDFTVTDTNLYVDLTNAVDIYGVAIFLNYNSSTNANPGTATLNLGNKDLRVVI